MKWIWRTSQMLLLICELQRCRYLGIEGDFRVVKVSDSLAINCEGFLFLIGKFRKIWKLTFFHRICNVVQIYLFQFWYFDSFGGLNSIFDQFLINFWCFWSPNPISDDFWMWKVQFLGFLVTKIGIFLYLGYQKSNFWCFLVIKLDIFGFWDVKVSSLDISD